MIPKKSLRLLFEWNLRLLRGSNVIMLFQSIPKSNSFIKVLHYESEVLMENADSTTLG